MAPTRALQSLGGAQLAIQSCSALPGVVLAGIGAPAFRRALSKRSLIRKTVPPASGFVPPGKDVLIASFIPAPPAAMEPETGVATATGAGAGEAVATEVAAVAPVFGRKAPKSQVSVCGANATSSPFIPVTRRPWTAVLPAPRRELSGSRARVKGPSEFCTWMRNVLGAFSTL